jgi:hypothetical protein
VLLISALSIGAKKSPERGFRVRQTKKRDGNEARLVTKIQESAVASALLQFQERHFRAKRMKATIWGHTRLPDGHQEIHRFAFELHDGSAAPPVRESVSLRTARVVVAHLQDGNALIQMFRAIVNSEPADYDHLVGQTFKDDFIENGPSDRVDESHEWQNADR